MAAKTGIDWTHENELDFKHNSFNPICSKMDVKLHCVCNDIHLYND